MKSESKSMEEKTWFIQYLPQIFIVSGIILTAIGGWISFSRMIEYRSENLELGRENKTLNQNNLEETGKVKDISALNALLSIENKSLISENTTLTKLNQDLIKSNIEISNNNKELSNQIINRAETLNSEITGGDTYLEIKIEYNKEKNQFLVLANVKGEFNPKNINLTIDESRKTVYNTKIDELNKGVQHQLKILPIPKNRDYLLYEIRIHTRNGSYHQYAFLKKRNDMFYCKMIYFNDAYRQYCLGEKYFPYKYPENIWDVYPTIRNLNVKYDLENKEAHERAKSMLRGGYNTIRQIKDFTGVPIQTINKLKLEIEKEASK